MYALKWGLTLITSWLKIILRSSGLAQACHPFVLASLVVRFRVYQEHNCWSSCHLCVHIAYTYVCTACMSAYMYISCLKWYHSWSVFFCFYILSFFTLVCLCVLHACECGSMWKPEADVEIVLVFFPTLLFEAGFLNQIHSSQIWVNFLASLLQGSHASAFWSWNFRQATTPIWLFPGLWGSKLWPNCLKQQEF